MKETQHDLQTRIESLHAKLNECRASIYLEEAMLEEDISRLRDVQIAVNRRQLAIQSEKALYGEYDMELALLDGRLKKYTMAGTICRSKAVKTPTVEEAVAVLKGLDPATLAALLNK